MCANEWKLSPAHSQLASGRRDVQTDTNKALEVRSWNLIWVQPDRAIELTGTAAGGISGYPG